MSDDAGMDVAEALTNASVGWFVSCAATYWLLPIWGLTPSLTASGGITTMFFALSFVRALVLRGFFRRFAAPMGDGD